MNQELLINEDLKAGHIIVVDDEAPNLKLVERVLEVGGYNRVTLIEDPTTVVEIYKQSGADLFLIDLNMPVMDGFELIAALMALQDEFLPPVLVLTAQQAQEYRQKALDLGARDFVTKPFVVNELLARVRNQMEIRQAQSLLRQQNKQLEEIVQERTRELVEAHQQLHESRLQVVRRLGRAAEYRDNETGLHIIRMSYISVILGRAAGMSEDDLDLLLNASPMHDIGKIGVPDQILLKPGKFEPEEWEIMKTHARIGADILSGDDSPMMAMAREIALTHHEKWDGSGYPDGLKGEAIPLVGRISALADVFDALTSERPYKKAWTVDDAVALIKEGSGAHFDPVLVEYFIENLDLIIEVKDKYVEPEQAAEQ
ncbi:MAG: response regulator [Gammaproteobacteria bacterium]|nr:response regulator [Gammaproteobacteria bacterium]